MFLPLCSHCSALQRNSSPHGRAKFVTSSQRGSDVPLGAGRLDIPAEDYQRWNRRRLQERTEGVMWLRGCSKMQKTGFTGTVVSLCLYPLHVYNKYVCPDGKQKQPCKAYCNVSDYILWHSGCCKAAQCILGFKHILMPPVVSCCDPEMEPVWLYLCILSLNCCVLSRMLAVTFRNVNSVRGMCAINCKKKKKKRSCDFIKLSQWVWKRDDHRVVVCWRVSQCVCGCICSRAYLCFLMVNLWLTV